MKCLYCLAEQSAELATKLDPPTKVSRSLLNLLISITSNTEYIWFYDRAEIYKVNWHLRWDVSELSLQLFSYTFPKIITVACTVDFHFFKDFTAPNPIFTPDADNNSCFISSLMEF